MIHMEYYLIVSAIMFFAGIYGFFTRRNTLAILISIELILNATDINFAVFNRFLFPTEWKGISLPCSPLPSRPPKRQ
jgi:NADH-quinone oxidoreductase subunit K